MEGVPCFRRNVLGDLVAFFRVQIHALEVSHDDTDGGVFRYALSFGVRQIVGDGCLGRGDPEILLRPVDSHGGGDAPLHKGLVNAQNPVMGNALFFQHPPGKQNVLRRFYPKRSKEPYLPYFSRDIWQYFGLLPIVPYIWTKLSR